MKNALGLVIAGSCLLGACTTCREETEPADREPEEGELAEKVIHAPEKTTPTNYDNDPPPPPRSAREPTSPDPEDGDFTVEESLAGLAGDGPVQAVIHSDLGRVTCKLYTDKAPKTAANFIGLARGTRPFWDAHARAWTKRPFYRMGFFHRVIPEYMIQGGCPYGDGSGSPGYEFADEHWEGETHDKAGLLCMANRGPDTNGSQFFITDGTGAQQRNLDRLHSYTIFGECTPTDVVAHIARVPQRGAPTNRPMTPVRITRVFVERQNGSDHPAAEAEGEAVGPTRESTARPGPYPGPEDYRPPGALLPPRPLPPPEKRRFP
jgi:peptidyl-prolyl cis-trans isomerase A (cyclophilin A)